jgi:probable addiction module antidote protein
MTETLTTYDPAAALVDDEEIAAFMADACETGDAGYITHALGIVERAKDMTRRSRGQPTPPPVRDRSSET